MWMSRAGDRVVAILALRSFMIADGKIARPSYLY
ncbi:hypothetical protein Bcell_0980 [Evansella cellulosilytica DSM 2522]|uniref:Uncharacterized protein n=1 Tax=Evansella cellulosilytica (strain ATCC 21833 / DSM 2522 / FERM P-1141 / JCM 9156 / N-4) TaxID=649639 RepID=E6U209_EVAC2|nr:hypothetical protein Bcell_0980 [Evansella cellulosilytica DSM 2522]